MLSKMHLCRIYYLVHTINSQAKIQKVALDENERK